MLIQAYGAGSSDKRGPTVESCRLQCSIRPLHVAAGHRQSWTEVFPNKSLYAGTHMSTHSHRSRRFTLPHGQKFYLEQGQWANMPPSPALGLFFKCQDGNPPQTLRPDPQTSEHLSRFMLPPWRENASPPGFFIFNCMEMRFLLAVTTVCFPFLHGADFTAHKTLCWALFSSTRRFNPSHLGD